MSTQEDAYERDLSVNTVVHIPSWAARYCGDIGGVDQEDLIEEMADGSVHGAPRFPALWADTFPGPEEVADWLGEFLFRNGGAPLMVQYATPVASRFSDDGKSYSFSWGHYALQWFWGESIEECAVLARKWRESMLTKWRDEERAKAA